MYCSILKQQSNDHSIKKLILIAAISLTTFAQGQETNDASTTTERKHELRLDAIELIATTHLELDYEYVIDKNSGAGAAVTFNLSGDDTDLNWAFTPFYRQYFFNKKDFGARGLFAEGNLELVNYDSFQFFGNDVPSEIEKQTLFGAGFAIGQKWVSNNGFVFEISAGVGRYFGVDAQFDVEEFYFRGGILVGYRF